MVPTHTDRSVPPSPEPKSLKTPAGRVVRALLRIHLNGRRPKMLKEWHQRWVGSAERCFLSDWVGDVRGFRGGAVRSSCSQR